MNSILVGYDVSLSTWMYLSAMLIVAVYFRFGRVWSSRNLDLLLLLAVSPGMLFVRYESTRVTGFVWLLIASGLFVIRASVDPMLRWRPRFEQNMNSSGLHFLCVCAMLFLAVRAVNDDLPTETARTFQRADAVIERDASAQDTKPEDGDSGPAMTGIAAVTRYFFLNYAEKSLAICAHLAVIIGLIIAGKRIFESPATGAAMATLYLLLPTTAFDVGAVNHVLPAALTLWAFVVHRHPRAAGALLGVACGTQLFPLFLLPIWARYYGRIGIKQFLTGLFVAAGISVASLLFTSTDPGAFVRQSLGSFNPYLITLNSENASGFWIDDGWAPYRLPVLAVYFIVAGCFAFFPSRKSLEVLLSQSVILIVATQFWYPDSGGTFIQWYLPLLLLMMFRPRLPESFEELSNRESVGRRSEPASGERLVLPTNARVR